SRDNPAGPRESTHRTLSWDETPSRPAAAPRCEDLSAKGASMRSTQRGILPILATGLLAIVAFAGCCEYKVTSPPPGGGTTGSTTFTGTVTRATSSGTLAITVATETPQPQRGAFPARATVTAT